MKVIETSQGRILRLEIQLERDDVIDFLRWHDLHDWDIRAQLYVQSELRSDVCGPVRIFDDKAEGLGDTLLTLGEGVSSSRLIAFLLQHEQEFIYHDCVLTITDMRAQESLQITQLCDAAAWSFSLPALECPQALEGAERKQLDA